MASKAPKKLVARKLLVAAVGVATVNYVAAAACGGETSSTSSSSSGSSGSSGPPPTSGNLPAPDAEPPPTSGNLPAPPPVEAGADADAGDAGDAEGG